MITAIITGASSGLGREYVSALAKKDPSIESFWLIARRKDRLDELAEQIGKEKCFVLPLDLTKKESFDELRQVLEDTKPEVKYLINNAGFGKLGDFIDTGVDTSVSQIDLNCTSLTAVTGLTLPYMQSPSEIINVASIASFAPNTRLTVYSSTKAYVYSFSRGLREELKSRKINVLAVCPGPMDTEFLSVADIKPGASRTFDLLPHLKESVVAKKSLIASKKGKAVYTNHIFYKLYHLLSKILPKSIIMKLCKT